MAEDKPPNAEVLRALEVLQRAMGGGPELTFGQVWHRYVVVLPRKVKDWLTDARRGATLCRRWADLPVSQLGDEAAARYRAARAEDVSRRGRAPSVATVNRELALARHVLNWARRERLIVENPLAQVTMEREADPRQTVLTDEQVDAALAHADPFLRALVFALYDTGPRVSEVLNLRRDQFDGRSQTARLAPSETKNGKARILRLSRRAIEAIGALPQNIHSPFIFANPRTLRPWTRCWVLRLWQRALAEAGVVGANGERVVIHSLRHAFVVNSRRKYNLPTKVAMLFSGHSTPAAWYRYGAVDESEADEAHAKIDLVLGGRLGPKRAQSQSARGAKKKSTR